MLDGEWSDWSEWDNCTLDCGGGNQTRTRTCTNPEPQFNGTDCGADDSETQVCNDQPCPIGYFGFYLFFLKTLYVIVIFKPLQLFCLTMNIYIVLINLKS